MNEARHSAIKGFDRSERDVDRYNAAARRVAESLGVPIDDLFDLVMRSGRDQLLTEDGVHYTPDGYARLGRAVAEALRRHAPADR